MEKSIINYPKFLILCDGTPVGCVSCKKIEERVYEVGRLCGFDIVSTERDGDR